MDSLKNIGRLFVLRIGGYLLQLFTVVYFTRQLAPNVLGEYFYFISTLGLVSIFAAWGINGAVEKYLSEGKEAPTWYATGLATNIVFALIGSSIIIVINTQIYAVIKSKWIWLFVVALLLGRIKSFYKHILRAEFKAALSGTTDLLQAVIFFMSAAIFVSLGHGAESLIISHIISSIAPIPLGVYLTSSTICVPQLEKAVELVKFAKYYVINVLGSKAYSFADVVLIGILLTKTDVAVYELAWRLILVAISLNGIIGTTVFAYISSADTQAEIEKELWHAMKYIALIPTAIIVGSVVIGPEVIALLFTTEYTSNESVITILAVGAWFQSFYFLFSRTLIGLGEVREAFYATLFGVGINVVLNVLLIRTYGLIGAASATTVSFIISALVYYWLLSRYIEIRLPTGRYTIQSIAAVFMGVVILAGYSVLGNITGIGVVSLVAVGSIVYTSLLLISKQIRNDIKDIIASST